MTLRRQCDIDSHDVMLKVKRRLVENQEKLPADSRKQMPRLEGEKRDKGDGNVAGTDFSFCTQIIPGQHPTDTSDNIQNVISRAMEREEGERRALKNRESCNA
ncbi:hypothetical protein RRG08_055717 [Elysia crispata]|uniref:Uncharacterized protein n=1 Tax=Elysia crispata TaxID=231223 RepID=A0AAE1AZE1_9GAST|nr:hypothetical protein RRG08_055717 [Elysia crispata]